MSLPFPPLDATFFNRPTVQVAKDLLGRRLIRVCPETGNRQAFRIVETEAYREDDPACHAYGRKTGRAAMLYREPGLAYVYLIYGMYHCLNVVTEEAGVAGAVLFRALEPLDLENAGRDVRENASFKTHGPGRLTRSLGITRENSNGIDLTDPAQWLYLAAGEPVAARQCVETTRIGIRQATDLPWRFYIRENAWVSVR